MQDITQLEQQLWEAVNANKLSFDNIINILNELKNNEIYIISRSVNGETFYDALFNKMSGWLPRELRLKANTHNEAVDIIKKEKLTHFIKTIEQPNLQLLSNFVTDSVLNSADLTFLLSIALNQTDPNLEILEFLVNRGAQVNGLGLSGHRPIYLAVSLGRIDIIRWLLEHGAELSLPDLSNRTLIFAALKNNQLHLIPELIQLGCNINAADHDGQTPLHYAVMAGKLEQAEILLQNGADVFVRNYYNETPLDNATSGTRGIDFICSHFIPDYTKNTIINERKKIAEKLRIAQQEQTRKARIFNAIENQNNAYVSLQSLDIMDMDIEQMIIALRKLPHLFSLDLSHNKFTAIGIRKLITYLEEDTFVFNLNLQGNNLDNELLTEITERFSPNKVLKRFIERYEETEKLEIVTALLKSGANFSNTCSNESWLLSHFAAYRGHLETICLLIQNSIDISEPQNDGETVLHLAAMKGHFEIIKLALNNHLLQVDPITLGGHTPLSLAIQKGDIQIVEFLLKRNANPNHKINGKILLEIAVEKQFEEIVKLLLKYGSKNIISSSVPLTESSENNCIDNILHDWRKKEIALCEAAAKGNLDEAKELLGEGIHIDTQDDEDKQPLQYALENKHWETAAWLLFQGASYGGTRALSELTTQEKDLLAKHTIALQETDEKAPLYYLNARTHYVSKRQKDSFEIKHIYKELFQDEIINPILKIMHYCEQLKIRFDPQGTDTQRANHHTEEGTQGNYSPSNQAIDIAGKAGSYECVRGIVIHEFCHLACGEVWKNERNPYFEDTGEKKQFSDIYEMLKVEYQDKEKKKILPTVVTDIFNYPDIKHHRELIVRVPQIIANYGIEYTSRLCEKSAGFKELYLYYQEIVLPQFQTYLQTIRENKKSRHENEIIQENAWELFIIRQQGNNAEDTMSQNEAILIIQSLYRRHFSQQTAQHLQLFINWSEKFIAYLENLGMNDTAETFRKESQYKVGNIFSVLSNNNLFFAQQQAKNLTALPPLSSATSNTTPQLNKI